MNIRLYTLMMLILLITQNSAFCQVSNPTTQQAWVESSVSSLSELEQELVQLSENPNNGWRIQKTWTDQIEMKHDRMIQEHNAVPVEGAVVIAHQKDNRIKHFNGLVVKGRFASSTPSLSQQDAIVKIHEQFSGSQFYYEDRGMEQLVKEHKADITASFYPTAELIYLDKNFSNRAENYRLAYKLDVWVKEEIDHMHIYLDAHTGEVIWTHNQTTSGCFNHEGCASAHTCDHDSGESAVVPRTGTGHTYYNGIQEFVADSVGVGQYILLDETRGRGIHTRNALRTTNATFARDFEDDDNFWDMRNQFKDEAALDAHWGTTETYDFWNEEYGWSSFDGNGSVMTSLIHWDLNWFNASWNGMFARFGDGNGDPLTYIDITAHEFAHGLTGNTSGLIYQDESGALNESFSDIFGTAVEFAALGDTAAFYSLGIPVTPFRDMSNPNRFNDPDTYFGANWTTGAGDNGGVHTNSGVQNFWWYLLSNGGTGTNDNGSDYEVDSLGMQKASAIAFRNVTTYLTPSSTYIDARYGALLSAKDLYGACSPEVEAVSQAWFAVGIGSPKITTDLELESVDIPGGSCGTTTENFGFSFRLNPTGCDVRIDSGTVVEFGYTVNNGTPVIENMVLNEDIMEGAEVDYQFTEKPDVSVPGLYEVVMFVNVPSDSFAMNDTISDLQIRNPITHVTSPSRVQFRSFGRSLDSFYVNVGENAEAEISLNAANRDRPGRLGFIMTGKDASFNNIEFPTNEAGNFTLNPSFGSKICFCVDATDWAQVKVAFDRQQTYSEAYRIFLGQDVPDFVSSLRMVLNGSQVGPQFHPNTYLSDPWVTDTFHLDGVEGQFFEFCFEGKHFIDRNTDGSIPETTTRGDNTYLDEVLFFDPFTVSNKKVITTDLKITPNPGSDYLTIQGEDTDIEQLKSVEVRDQAGRLILLRTTDLDGSQIEVATGDWNSGVYQIILQGQGKIAVGKWVKL